MANEYGIKSNKGGGRTAKAALVNNGVPEKASSEFKNRFIHIPKNVVKSTGHLTVDVIGSYLPNVGSLAEITQQAKDDVRKSFSKSLNTVKGIFGKGEGASSDSEKNPTKFLKDTAKGTFDDTLSRLRQGKFYQSAKEKEKADAASMANADPFGFNELGDLGDLNEDLSGSSLTTELSDEPFGELTTRQQRETMSGNVRQGRGRRPPSRPRVISVSNDAASQVRLGDKMVFDIIQHSTNAVIGEQERLFTKQFAADELRHVTHIKYQANILKGVNAIAAHLDQIEGPLAENTSRFQETMLKMQEDTHAMLEELKQAVIVTSSGYEEDLKKQQSKMAKIIDGPNGLNYDEYKKNVKGNVMEAAYKSVFGSFMGLTPLLGTALNMGDMGGMGGAMKFDPLSSLLRLGANSLISRQTRGKLAGLNDVVGNIGPLLIGQMNKMARFGNSKLSRGIGEIFGVKNAFAERMDLGLKDPEAKVNWTAKSERSLTEVIPGYLSKITAAITGTEETFYDYSKGRFIKSSTINRDYQRQKKGAWYNSVLSKYQDDMVVQWKETTAGKKMGNKISDSDMQNDIDRIFKNISLSGHPYVPEQIKKNKAYQMQILEGVKHPASLSVFDEMYNRFTQSEQSNFNIQTQKRKADRDNSDLAFRQSIARSGGGSVLQDAMAEDELAQIEYQIAHGQHLQIDKNLNKHSMLYVMRTQALREAEQKRQALLGSRTDRVNAVRINEDGSAGMIGGASQTASTSMVGTLNNIYSLLSQGIFVYPRRLGRNEVPGHLKKIYAANKSFSDMLRQREAQEQQEADASDEKIYERMRVQRDIERANKNLADFSTLGDLFGLKEKTKPISEHNPLNRLANWVAEKGININSTLFNAQGTSGEGFFEQESQYERDIDEFRGTTGENKGKRKPKEKKATNSKIFAAVKRIYNKYGLDTESTGSTEVGREELLADLYGELRAEGIPADEAISVVEDITGDTPAPPSEDKDIKIDSSEISSITGIAKATIENAIGKVVSPNELKEYLASGKLKSIFKAPDIKKMKSFVNKRIKAAKNEVHAFFEEGGNYQFDENDEAVLDENGKLARSEEGTGHRLIREGKKTARKIKNEVKESFGKGGGIKYDDNGDIAFEDGKIAYTEEGVVHKAMRLGREAASGFIKTGQDSIGKVLDGFSGENRNKKKLEVFLKDNPDVNMVVTKLNKKREVISSLDDLNLYVTEHPRSKLARVMKNANPLQESALGSITSQVQGVLSSYLGKAKTLFSRNGDTGKDADSAKESLAETVAKDSGVKDKFTQFGSFMKGKLDNLIKPKEDTDQEKQEHQMALATYNILEETIQELVGSDGGKEPSFDDIEDAVDSKIKEGKIDKDIANAVLRKARSIEKDKDKGANPINAYYSAIYELKESYNEKYRKDHSLVRSIIKKITKGGIKSIAATTLLVTGHPIMAAMLAFGPKKTIQGAKAGIKGAIKSSKFLAQLSGKVLGTAAKMTPGILKTGFGFLGKVLSGDIFDSKPKKSREEYEQERQVAALAFTTLEGLHREIMETNPDASMGDIKKAILDKVKSGGLDKDIADAVIKATETNAGDKDADATPLGAFLQAILALKKQYAKEYRKNTNVFKKVAMGILKGVGKGVGAAALLMAGHPIMAAALALSGPAKLMRSLKKKTGKGAGKGTDKIPETNPIAQEKQETIDNVQGEVNEQAETAKEGLLKKLPSLALGAAGGIGLGMSKARQAVGSTFSTLRNSVSGLFTQERREGSAFDIKEDRREEKQEKVSEETLNVLKEIRDNTFDTEEETDEKEGRQKRLFKDVFKNVAVGGGGAGIGALIASFFGGGGGGEGDPGGGGTPRTLKDAGNMLINKGIKSLGKKAITTLAGKGGRIGKAAGAVSKFLKLGGTGANTAAKAASAVGKAGKLGSLLGKVGGLGGKIAGIGGKAAGLAGKAGGLLGKVGGLAKFAGPALGGIAKFAGPVGIALAAAQALGGGVKGWKNAANVAGLEEGQTATTGQKVGSAASGALSALTLGLIKPEQMYKFGSKVGDFFGGKKKPKLDADGNPIIDPKTGQPVYEREGGALRFLAKGGLIGAGIRGAKKLYDKNKAKKAEALEATGEPTLDENGEPVPTDGGPNDKSRLSSLGKMLLKMKPKDGESLDKSRLSSLGKNLLKLTPHGLAITGGMALYNKLKGKMADGGEPTLDENGNPIAMSGTGSLDRFDKLKNLGKNLLKMTPHGLAISGGMALAKKVKGFLNPAEGTSQLDAVTGAFGQVKKKTNNELLLDIHNLLSKGIMVFPSQLTSDNAPEHLKDALKKGQFQNAFTGESGGRMTGGGSFKNKSLFEHGRNAVSNAIQWAKDTAGRFLGGSSYQSSGSGGRNAYQGGSSNYTSTGNYNSQTVSYDANSELEKIKDPKQASLFFYQNKEQAGNAIQNMLDNGQYDELEKLADRIKDPASMGQNKNIDSLDPEFSSRVRNFMNSPEAQALGGIDIREAGRSPLTQLAYFTPGRTRNTQFIHKLFKKAGFSGGAWNTTSQVTQTMGSNHFTGRAIDIEDHGKGVSYYQKLAPIAKKYGLEWGGDWKDFRDYPHFELPQNDNAIGYKGPPEENEIPPGATQRADGLGSRGRGRMGSADIVRSSFTATNTSRYRANNNMGTTTASSLQLKESPIVTSERLLLTQINDAISIQKAIHDEQKRHNNVAETFFETLMKTLQTMAQDRPSSGGGLTESQIHEINSLSTIMEQERKSKERFSQTARQLAEGY